MNNNELEEVGLLDWQQSETITSVNGNRVYFSYKVQKENDDYVLLIRAGEYWHRGAEEIEISKIVHSIEEVYKVVDAIKNLVDTLNLQSNMT